MSVRNSDPIFGQDKLRNFDEHMMPSIPPVPPKEPTPSRDGVDTTKTPEPP